MIENTSTGQTPYEMGLPCKNPQCKSYGKSHPNCKCYSFAKGGEVDKHFCSERRPHNKECEHFAEGGESSSRGGLNLDANATPVLSLEDPLHPVNGYLAHLGGAGLSNQNNDLDKYYKHVKHGQNRIDGLTNHVFGDEHDDGDETRHEKNHEKMKSWIDNNGQYEETQNVLGQGTPPPQSMLEQTHPTHHMLIKTMQGRVGNYLNTLKPQENAPKLTFDEEPDQTEKKRTYENAMKIAVNPLRILQDIRKGTIDPEDVKHFTSMYPELNQSIQQELTKKILNSQLKGEKPSFKVRQGLSMLMGADLSSDFTPANIRAAQATFNPPHPPPQPQGQKQQKKPKAGGGGSKSSLSKSNQAYMTHNQSLTARSQRQK